MAVNYLQIIKTTSETVKTYPHETGTIFYVTDLKQVLIDREDEYRYDVSNLVIVIESEIDFTNLGNYTPDRLYIVTDANVFYLTDITGKPNRVLLYEDIKDTLLPDPAKLETVQLFQNGIPIAPITSTTALFSADGQLLTGAIEELTAKSKQLNQIKVATVRVAKDHQVMFTIPYPRYDYELNRETFHVFLTRDGQDRYVKPDEYTVNDTVLILNTGILKTDTLKFVFHYHVVMDLGDLPDNSVKMASLSEDIRMALDSTTDPDKFIFPDGESLLEKINTLEIVSNMVVGSGGTQSQGDNNSISDRVRRIEQKANDIYDLATTKFRALEEVNAEQTVINNGIVELVRNIDIKIGSMMRVQAVKRVQRGLATIPTGQEVFEVILDHEIIPEKTSINLNGDAFYNETPYVFHVASDRFSIRLKAAVSNSRYQSTVSWECVEYN